MTTSQHCTRHSVLNTNANLLVALDALVRERSVTRAAKLTGVTQSSMSSVLKQLRALFDDPLLVRDGNAMRPTPLALQLGPLVRSGLEKLDQALAGGRSFDPATSRECFVVAMGDRSEPVLLPDLLQRLRRQAPELTLQVVRWGHSYPPPGLASGDIDVSIGILVPDVVRGWSAVSPGHDTAHHSVSLYDSGLVTVVRADHPRVAETLTLDEFCALGHVLVTELPGGRGIVDDALAELDRGRRVVARLPGHAAVCRLVGRSDLIATIDRRVAQLERDTAGLRLIRTPVPLPAGHIGMAWHERTHEDAARRWLREQILAVARGK